MFVGRQQLHCVTPGVPGVEVNAGIMCAAPEGAGFQAMFDHLKLEIGESFAPR